MPRAHDVFQTKHPDDQPPHRLVSGLVSKGATTTSDTINVTVKDSDGGRELHTELYWMPRVDNDGNTVYPVVGDPVLVAFDEDGLPWVTAWWSNA